MPEYIPGHLDLGDVEVVVDDVLYGWHDAFLDGDRCFLCGTKFDDKLRTPEHVIPKWLQRRFDLWDERITLVNGSQLPYRNATVPACEACNTGPLNDLETEISAAFEAGRAGVERLPPKRLWQWLLKLSYGLIRIEYRLLADRSNPDGGVIGKADSAGHRLAVTAGAFAHLYLQTVIGRTTVTPRHPMASFFIFDTQTPSVLRDQFDLTDMIYPGPLIALRIGNVGLVAMTTDLGALEFLGVPGLNEAAALDLHPLQFREVVARVIYGAHLREPGTTVYVEQTGPAHRRVTISDSWTDDPPRQRLWDDEMGIYARILEGIQAGVPHLRVPREGLQAPERCPTWLFDEAGHPVHLQLEDG